MKRALLVMAMVIGLGLPAGAWAGRTAAQPGKKAPVAQQQTRTRATRPTTARAAILHAMRSRGVVKPSQKLFANSGIAGGPSLIFSEQNVEKRVTRKGALPGQRERVNVVGRAVPSKTNKSGWSVSMKITPAKAPAQPTAE
jgi:glutamate-1-semialdehyde aminotransferase